MAENQDNKENKDENKNDNNNDGKKENKKGNKKGKKKDTAKKDIGAELKKTILEPIKRPIMKQKAAAAEKTPRTEEETMALKQRRSLIMFISASVLAMIIFIPGDMLWLWAHNAVRGTFSMLSLFWPALLMFLAVATMLDKTIPRLAFRTSFAAGFAASLNAAIYIFSTNGETPIKQAFADGIIYSGGGALGYLLGIPFVKLFGATPAKILIVPVMAALAAFALGIPVKQLYEKLFRLICAKFAQLGILIKKKIAQIRPKRITDDDYFDDDDYDSYDIDDIDDDDIGGDAEEIYEKEENDVPLSFSESLFDHADTLFREEDDEPEDEAFPQQDAEPFVTDIHDDEPPFDTDDSSENKSDSKVLNISTKSTAADIKISDPLDIDDEVLQNIFGDDFLEKPSPDRAAQAAREITASKKGSIADIEKDEPKDKPHVNNITKKKKQKYIFPPTDLLSESKHARENYDKELRENAQKLIEALESFAVGAKILDYCRGPSVTRYEIKPAKGVKIAKITSLSDDIALCLAANGGVRIEAPIPGKSAIGVEIPNKTVTSVSMRELFESAEFNKNRNKKKLECVLGKNVAGQIIMMDLASMPHLLIAGTTGSGKSVCVNSILMSILLRATPDEVKMILIDPKLVEFTKYKGIPHLLVPVVSDVKKAAGALGWAVSEMEDRYKQLSAYNVKDIDSYNAMVEKNLQTMTPEEIESPGEGETINGEYIPPRAVKKMPKIVIAIDELADLMMAAPGEVEDYICRLAQKARAAGMHLVIATQRPSVNVITGVIKANIPSRISLKVASHVDSKTILDQGGGEKLIGKGDMLYHPVGEPKPIRVQGGFSSDSDIEAVTDFIKKHAASEYDSDISEKIDLLSESVGVKGGGAKEAAADELYDSDPLLEKAIEAVVREGQASASMLQRKLGVGYARAGRMVDTMEQLGIIGPHEGSKARKVLITEQEWIERKLAGIEAKV